MGWGSWMYLALWLSLVQVKEFNSVSVYLTSTSTSPPVQGIGVCIECVGARKAWRVGWWVG